MFIEKTATNHERAKSIFKPTGFPAIRNPLARNTTVGSKPSRSTMVSTKVGRTLKGLI